VVRRADQALNITYRPAVPEDFDFLFRLHTAAMRGVVEAAFGAWDDAWQVAYARRHFDPAVLRIIQLAGQDVGVLHVQDRAEELFLVSLEILPEHQRKGIGTHVIIELIRAASAQDKPVALQVLKTNLSARALYQRLGFGITGENATHYIMAWENAQ
jgi:ribosomal protein S18 acetylase RimI-like enzyme